MTEQKQKLRHWVKHGIVGAVCVLLTYVGLIILQSVVTYGSKAYEVVHIIVWGGVSPVLIPIEKMGIYGCEAMAYIMPIFLLIFLYLAAIGFGIGSLVSWLTRDKKK